MMKRVTAKIKLGTNRKTCYIGLRGKNPFEIIKRNLAWSKKSFGIMKKKMPAEKFEMWKKKATK
jgi:hypothetical protein